MARAKSGEDLTTLQMALVGYEIEKRSIENKIREIKALLKGKRVGLSLSAGEQKPGNKRVMSAAGRRRIAVAQKKRWAEHRKRMAHGR